LWSARSLPEQAYGLKIEECKLKVENLHFSIFNPTCTGCGRSPPVVAGLRPSRPVVAGLRPSHRTRPKVSRFAAFWKLAFGSSAPAKTRKEPRMTQIRADKYERGENRPSARIRVIRGLSIIFRFGPCHAWICVGNSQFLITAMRGFVPYSGEPQSRLPIFFGFRRIPVNLRLMRQGVLRLTCRMPSIGSGADE
jgi:hypothetical protein